MNADDYQKSAARTLIDKPDSDYTDVEMMLVWCATGLAGEAGEVIDNVKKAVFHRHGIDRDKLSKELGDVAWYLAGVCSVLGLRLSDVMQQNVHKLLARYPEGYSSEASKGWQTTR